VPLRDAKAARLTRAILANIENWERRVLELADAVPPGQKAPALHLAKDIEMARLSLIRLIQRSGHE
jgi:hypothetical protein